jgi:hypothetical protein
MAEVEMLYSARQLSDELGLTLQMLSKYAQTYTKLTKQQIKKQGREGRHFTAAQREVIKNAREMVQTGSGVTVDDAMRKALIFDSDAIETPALATAAPLDLERLKTLLSEALRDEIATPLIGEIQALRLEIQELKQDKDLQPSPEIKNLGKVEDSGAVKGNPARQIKRPDEGHGYLVRLAMKIEKWLGRS